MSTINKIAIKNSLGEYDESKIGAQAEDVIISRDADGKIIETIETPGVVIGSTEGISTTIKEIDERIASTSSIGQVQIGTGLEIDNNGVLTPSFGNTTGSICEGNDPRLASIGTVANDLVLSSNGDGDAAGATFNGGASVKISYNSIGAAPNQKATTSQWGQIKIKSNSGLGVDSTNGLSLSSHASASNTYGVGTNANYGHLKIVDATSSTSGTSYNAAAGVAASASSVADVISQISNLQSHIGMIIHSTTLDTEAKVKAIYGGTKWIRHSGYILRGATSGVVANSAVKTGGNDNAIIPYHTHTMQASGVHNHGSIPVAGQDMSDGYNAYRLTANVENYTVIPADNSAHTHTIDYAGTNGNTTNANIPNYKSVYIWERTE